MSVKDDNFEDGILLNDMRNEEIPVYSPLFEALKTQTRRLGDLDVSFARN